MCKPPECVCPLAPNCLGWRRRQDFDWLCISCAQRSEEKEKEYWKNKSVKPV